MAEELKQVKTPDGTASNLWRCEKCGSVTSNAGIHQRDTHWDDTTETRYTSIGGNVGEWEFGLIMRPNTD